MEDLRRRVGGRPIYVVGFSMGGLLALRLARQFPERIAAQVIMAAPLRMRPAQMRGVRALAMLPVDFRSYPFACIPKIKGSDISDPEMRDANPSLPRVPDLRGHQPVRSHEPGARRSAQRARTRRW